MLYSKLFISLFWLFLLTGLFIPMFGFDTRWIVVTILLVLITHIIEFVLFYSYLKKASGSITYHAMQISLFGIFHYLSVKRQQQNA